MRNEDAAIAKLFASEAVGRAADSTIQIYGGMGLMEELPIERLWRDARLDRIWDGTSEIQRHIISRTLLREYGGMKPGAGPGDFPAPYTGDILMNDECPE